MKNLIDHKKNIAKHFNQAAKSYEKAADLQKTIGLELLSLTKQLGLSASRLIDIGAGCGTLSTPIQETFSQAKYYSLDIAHNMLLEIKADTSICADFDKMPIATHGVDFVFSNMTLQWSLDLKTSLEELWRCLCYDGYLVLSLVAEGTLMELSQQNSCDINHFHGLGKLKEIISTLDAEILLLEQKKFYKYCKSYLDLMIFLKKTGANYVINRSHSKISKKLFQSNKTENVKATFNIVYIILRKKT